MTQNPPVDHTQLDGNALKSYGNWSDEKPCVEYLAQRLNDSGLFNIYREIRGRIIHPKPVCEDKDMRIDFILSPTAKFIRAGWNGGPIGIECKRSDTKINMAFAQVLDYSRTVFLLPNGFMFMCQYFFIFPFRKANGFMASVMAQNRIGTAEDRTDGWNGDHIQLFCGEQLVFRYSFRDDKIKLGKCDFGFRTGSR